MIKRDYHTYTVDDALSNTEELIGYLRMNNRTEDVEFIVGHGNIRIALIDLLRSYGLNPTIQMGNTGVIVCAIE